MIKCSVCNENSVYFNPVNKKEYCKQHFYEYFEASVKKNIDELNLNNPKIMVYYSGGKDSAVLLYVLKKLNFNISAITSDIGINSTFEKMSSLGKKVCKSLNLKYYRASFEDFIGVNMSKIVKLYGVNQACNYCSELRNIVMDIASKNLGFNVVASGHNCDDIARFLQNNYLKNDIFRIVEFASKIYPSMKIKNKIKYENPIQIKPLIYLTEKEISLYCFLNNIETIDACCGFTNPNENKVQSYRGDLTYVLNYLEERYPGYNLKLIENYEKNILPIFEQCALSDKNFYLKRQCAFCKKEMNIFEKDVCLLCKDCAKKVELKINRMSQAHLIEE